ncbi:hypothetical protein [Streptomyces sp. NPDC014995]|uniref:hypothetical protein n=1 Tax=Streptomyces sp. NPDC014995 TaxID=3364936 RepID=UPI0036FC8B43
MTAERLLRGEAPDNAVDPAHRDEADRLARTLGTLAALSAVPAPADEELPGEAAALAAFRKARAERTSEPTPSADFGEGPADETAAPTAFRESGAECVGQGDRVEIADGGAGSETFAAASEALAGEADGPAAFRESGAEYVGQGDRVEGADRGAEAETDVLVAFREVRAQGEARAEGEGRTEDEGPAGGAEVSDGAGVSDGSLAGRGDGDGGLVRIGGRRAANGRARRRHPTRLAVAAALTVGMVGGVAAAAGTGVLPTPFDSAEPGPAASVSATATPRSNHPLVSPPPDATQGGGAGAATPGGSASGTPAPDAEGKTKGTDDPADRGGRPSGVTSTCRDLRDGKALDAERRSTLEGAAGGSTRVPAYCARVLDAPTGQGVDTGGLTDGGTGEGGGETLSGPAGGASGQDRQGDQGDQGTEGAEGNKGGKSDDGGKGGTKDDKGAGSGGTASGASGTSRGSGGPGASSASSGTVHRQGGGVGATPTPTYSAL